MKKYIIVLILILLGILVLLGYQCLNKSNDIDYKNIKFEARDNNLKTPDLMGEISNIFDNTITLKIISTNKSGNNVNVPKETDEDMQAVIPTFKKQYTGETKDIIIPNGTKIICRNAQENFDINDLEIGDVIGITYKEDKVTIDNIMLFGTRNIKPGVTNSDWFFKI